ncbi:hypothetical protein EKO04_004229 [Ascochyta lentis]|uniref:MACPF-like domain-containing protein n=1 Tax=Ascochyta lentis TaxID=205686 RepID=A0A8H7J649_9PLEO|nr:hypothetical protein EKO04_004229 [Ascochyta lentis]
MSKPENDSAVSPVKEPPLNVRIEEALNKGFHLEVLYRNHLNRSRLEPKITLTSSALASNDVHKVLLSDLRKTAGNALESKWSFCLINDATVQNEHSLGYYLSLFTSNVTQLLKLPDGPPEKDAGDLILEDLPTTYMLPTLTVLMTSAQSLTPSDGRDMQQAWLEKNQPDLKFAAMSELKTPTVPEDHKAEYITTEGWDTGRSFDVTGTGLLDCVIDMSMQDWRRVMLLNKLVYGSEIRGVRREDSDVTTPTGNSSLDIVNARVAAFNLKSGMPSKELQLPDFVEVMDSPTIKVTEVKSDLQSSLAKNAFSARAIEVMTGGGTPMISAAVSAGVAIESEKASGHLSGQKRTEYFATYNFPRVKLFLDEYTLEVSEDCELALEKLRTEKNMPALLEFQRRFGTIFATEIVLGGRLEATKFAKSEFVTDQEQEKDRLKASVGANFSSPQFFIGSKASTESQSGEDKSKLDLNSEAMLSWTAKGGNTILCTNPPRWAASVATFRNWRTIQQDEVLPLQTLLGRFPKFKDIPAVFQMILADYNGPAVAPSIPTHLLTQEWIENAKIRLLLDDAALYCGSGSQAQVAAPGEWLPQNSLFYIRDGNPGSTGERMMSGLRADYPLAFFFGEIKETLGPDYNSSFVDPSTGHWTREAGKSGKMRFSLRAADAGDKPWKPLPPSYLRSGDKVKLHYHGFDPVDPDDPEKRLFTEKTPPKQNQYPGLYNPRTRNFRFSTKDQALTGVDGYLDAVFTLMFVV